MAAVQDKWFVKFKSRHTSHCSIDADAKAMYNYLERGVVWREVCKVSPRLAKAVAQGLSSHSIMVMFGGANVYAPENGIVIGDPIASLLAAVTAQAFLSEAKKVRECLAVSALMDNFSFFVAVQDARAVFDKLQALARPYGLLFSERDSDVIFVAAGARCTMEDWHLLHRQFPKWRLALPPRDDLEAEFVEEAQRISPAAVQANKDGIRACGVPKGSDGFKEAYVDLKVKRLLRSAENGTRAHPRIALRNLQTAASSRMTFLAGAVSLGFQEWTRYGSGMTECAKCTRRFKVQRLKRRRLIRSFCP